MPSIGSTFSIAVSAMRAQQEAMDVTAHNIANANTEGYSRQRAVLAGKDPLVLATGVFGTGVEVANVQVIRDTWLDASYWRETSSASENDVRGNLLGRVETLLSEPSESGLSSTLDAFFSAWSEASSNPTSSTSRMVIQQAGANLADQLRNLAGDLDLLRQETESRLLANVDRINALAQEIAGLNERIVAEESGGHTAGDLRDSRARAIDELSRLVPVQVTHRENGTVGVLVSGVSVVDGANTGTLEVRSAGGIHSIGMVGNPRDFPYLGGEVAGLLTVLNTDLPNLRAELDDLAEALVTEVNALHQTGTNSAGATGIDFFDPAGTGAASIQLSAAASADPQAIALGTADGAGAYRAGANDVALALAALRDNPAGGLGTTFGDHFRQIVSDVGLEVRSATDLAEVHKTLAGQAEHRRASFSGVSTDEELVKLIQYQTGYAAAARIVTAVDDILKSLLAM